MLQQMLIREWAAHEESDCEKGVNARRRRGLPFPARIGDGLLNLLQQGERPMAAAPAPYAGPVQAAGLTGHYIPRVVLVFAARPPELRHYDSI
jgi:hypothetical protein